MSKTPEEPTEPDEFDAELADAITHHQTDETVRQNAHYVAVYYTTLTEAGVPEDHATELTCHWVALMQGHE